jgi:hypothetical protein
MLRQVMGYAGAFNENLTSSGKPRKKSGRPKKACAGARLSNRPEGCDGLEFRRDEIAGEINFKNKKVNVNYVVGPDGAAIIGQARALAVGRSASTLEVCPQPIIQRLNNGN